jgi:hypothetical protein
MENFSRYPPHTIQRLAELVLEPRRHYRSLTAYLHALDRIVHVTSGNNIYPLPPAVADMSQMSLLANDVGGASGSGGRLQTSTAAANSLGSDESLGGALLTPIPWLARRANGGGSEDGAGSSEDGSASSPVSAQGGQAAVASSTSGQTAAQQQPQPQQPATTATQGSASPQPQPQAQTQPPASAPATEDTAPSTRPKVRTESTETIEGPNGIGSIETVSVSVNGVPSTGAVLASRGVTQGELLRQEQRAGVVPLSQLVRQAQQQQQQQQQVSQAHQAQQTSQGTNDAEAREERVSNGGGDAAAGDNPDAAMETEEDIPHARGPSEIDDVDTGPQAGSGGATHVAVGSTSASGQPVVKMQGIDVEAAVGRKADGTSLRSSPPEERKPTPERGGEDVVPRSPKREAEDELEGEGKKVKVGGEDGGAKEDEEDEMKVDRPAEDVSAGTEETDKPEKDAEGDVVIRDPGPAEGESDKPTAEGESGA